MCVVQVESECGEGGECGDEHRMQQWVGKDYYNPFLRDFVELQCPFNSQSKYYANTHMNIQFS